MRFAALAIMTALSQTLTPPLRTIEAGAMSQIQDARFVTVHDQIEWSALWRAHAPDRPMPAVDWSKEMAVGVFLGTRTTAGYRVEIVGYRVEGGRVVVGYREAAPARGSITAQILTSPFALAAIPRRAGDVAFEKLD
jgi:hypothetical protein